jgi:hypothetical protein
MPVQAAITEPTATAVMVEITLVAAAVAAQKTQVTVTAIQAVTLTAAKAVLEL